MDPGLERGGGLVAVLLGWPAVMLSVGCFAAALARRSRSWAVAGCALAFPMLLYLTMTPRFQYLAPLGLIGLALATWRMTEAHRAVSLALTLPAFALLLVLGFDVFFR